MNEDQFWYGDLYLLNAYIKGYFKKTKYEAWLNGFYNYQAHYISLGNAFAENKSKYIDYPEYIEDDMLQTQESNIPKDNNDYAFLSQCY